MLHLLGIFVLVNIAPSNEPLKSRISRIARMGYDGQRRRLFFVLCDYEAKLWLDCEDDDEANNLFARLGRHMACDLNSISIEIGPVDVSAASLPRQ